MANGGIARSRASRELAGTVERGKNPEDGTDEGLATLVPHGLPKGGSAAEQGTRRSCVRGTETPREADPQALERHVSFSEGACR